LGETLDTAPHSGVARPDVPRLVQFYEPAVNKMSREENCVRARLRDLAFDVASDSPAIGSHNPGLGGPTPRGSEQGAVVIFNRRSLSQRNRFLPRERIAGMINGASRKA
jgi:hypothetical protein